MEENVEDSGVVEGRSIWQVSQSGKFGIHEALLKQFTGGWGANEGMGNIIILPINIGIIPRTNKSSLSSNLLDKGPIMLKTIAPRPAAPIVTKPMFSTAA